MPSNPFLALKSGEEVDTGAAVARMNSPPKVAEHYASDCSMCVRQRRGLVADLEREATLTSPMLVVGFWLRHAGLPSMSGCFFKPLRKSRRLIVRSVSVIRT